jgi:uncharacterized protein (TIGR02001 family)
MNFKIKTVLASISMIASVTAFAQAKPATPNYTLSYNVGAVTDYRFRGIEQSGGRPSYQGGVDFVHKNGIYLGVWAASNVTWIKEVNGATKGDYEVDFYGGHKGDIAPGLGYDVGFITYQYPGNNSGAASAFAPAGAYSKADTTEVYAGLTYGVASLKMFQSIGDFLGNVGTNASRYVDLSATFDLGKGFSLVPHFGMQTIPSGVGVPNNDANYSDYSLTLAKDFGKGMVVSLAAISTDAKKSFYTTNNLSSNPSRYLGGNTVVLGLKYNF